MERTVAIAPVGVPQTNALSPSNLRSMKYASTWEQLGKTTGELRSTLEAKEIQQWLRLKRLKKSTKIAAVLSKPLPPVLLPPGP